MAKSTKKITVILQEREYHKGEQCPYSDNPVRCQEGFCNRCYLHEEYVKMLGAKQNG